jgi:arylsulfatase
MRKRSLIIVFLGLVALPGCAPDPAVDSPAPPANVLLITIDALRADSVSWAGRDGFQTTPNLDALTENSAVFTQAVTSFPGTTASMPSLMTGLYPSFEGVKQWNQFTYHGFNEFETEEEAGRPVIGDALPMLAEILAGAGYRTIGFNTNPNLIADRNFNQGFTDYEDFGAYMKAARDRRQHPLEGAYPPANVVMARVVPTLRSIGDDPFFMWIHLMEPHSPYLPPEPFARMSPRDFTDLSDLEINGALYHFLHRQWGARPEQISHPSLDSLGISKEQLIEHLWGLYESEIRFCDAELGVLFDALRELEMIDETLVIVTADHGEEFFDHGYVTHHFESALAEELIRIPLLIRPPGGVPGGRRVTELVRMVDLAPTILDSVGLADESASMDGLSLQPVFDGGAIDNRVAFYSTIDFGIVRTDRWKYRLEKNHDGGEPVERLFDIIKDPMETEDLSLQQLSELAELRRQYVAFTERLAQRAAALSVSEGRSVTPAADVDEATQEQLEALGYLE